LQGLVDWGLEGVPASTHGEGAEEITCGCGMVAWLSALVLRGGIIVWFPCIRRRYPVEFVLSQIQDGVIAHAYSDT
jgi:hypothetical protein